MENLRKYTTISDEEDSYSEIVSKTIIKIYNYILYIYLIFLFQFAETSDIEKNKPSRVNKTKETVKKTKIQSSTPAKKAKLDKVVIFYFI